MNSSVEENMYEETSETDRRVALGLRPTIFPRDPKKSEHPDQSPCPAWCWLVEEEEGDEHEIDWRHPDRATHSLGHTVPVMASLYTGRWQYEGGDVPPIVDAATVTVDLTQMGLREPIIKVRLRHYPNGKERKLDDLLRLRVEDARELITALTYICDVAQGKRESIR